MQYRKVPCEARQPTPIWLPDGERLIYAAQNRLPLLDLRRGVSRELLNAGPGRLELAAGGGFGVSAATGHIYLSLDGEPRETSIHELLLRDQKQMNCGEVSR